MPLITQLEGGNPVNLGRFAYSCWVERGRLPTKCSRCAARTTLSAFVSPQLHKATDPTRLFFTENLEQELLNPRYPFTKMPAPDRRRREVLGHLLPDAGHVPPLAPEARDAVRRGGGDTSDLAALALPA